jgi:hypothetical protein
LKKEKPQSHQMAQNVANQAKWQTRAKKSSKTQAHKTPPVQTPPNTLNARSPPLGRHYHVSSLNHPISKSSINFVHNLSPFGNEFIKHNPREA